MILVYLHHIYNLLNHIIVTLVLFSGTGRFVFVILICVFLLFSILLPLLTTTLICVIVCGSVGSVNDNYFGKLKMQESLAQQDDRSLDSRLFNTGLFAIQSEIPIKFRLRFLKCYKKLLHFSKYIVNFTKKYTLRW